MSVPDQTSVTIGPVSDGLEKALRLAFARWSAAACRQYVRTYRARIRSGEVDRQGLLVAHRGGRLIGAVLCQPQVGRTALLWPPGTVPEEPEATARQLLAAACHWLAGQGVRVAHALLETVSRADDVLLRAEGFEPLATLLYLVCTEADFPTQCPSQPLAFEPYTEAKRERLYRLLEATYEQTLDCPKLNGLRSMEDVLAGYRATGVFAPERWLIVRHQGQDVGCLLLADHPREEHWELVYMGLVAWARGRGWGRGIVRYAQWLTRRAGRPRLLLAVDAANRPAVAIYAGTGFQAWDRRRIYLKVFSAAG